MKNLKATKGSFGEFGRVRRGTILRNLSEDRAKKLVAGGAYAFATDDEVKAAGKAKVIDGLVPAKSTETDGTPGLSSMKVHELKAFAKDKNIDLGEATKRDEIIPKIADALAEAEA